MFFHKIGAVLVLIQTTVVSKFLTLSYVTILAAI